MNIQLGTVTVQSIVEVDAGSIIQTAIPDATPERIRTIPWMTPHFANADGTLNAVIQSLVIQTPEHTIIVDTCNGNCKKRTDLPEWNNLNTSYVTQFAQAGITKEKVDIVIHTHLHCDHVGWDTTLENGVWVPTFTNAQYLIVDAEYDYWRHPLPQEISDDKAAFVDSVQPIVAAEKAVLVPSDYRVCPEVSLLPTHGHTPGHVSVVIESQNKRAVITGDVLYSPCQIAHPEWTTPFDTDPGAAVHTRNTFIQQFANTDTLVIGSHFPAPAGGYITKNATGYIFQSP